MNPVPIYVLVDDKTDSANHLGRLNVASISRDEIRFCLAHEGKIKIGSSEAYSSDLISIGTTRMQPGKRSVRFTYRRYIRKTATIDNMFGERRFRSQH